MPRKLAKRAATLAAVVGMALAGGALPISVAQAASAAPPAKYATADITFIRAALRAIITIGDN